MTWVRLTPSRADVERVQGSRYVARAQRFRLASVFNYSYDPDSHQTLITVAGALHSVVGDHTATLDELLGDPR